MRAERGQVLVEYCLIISLVVFVALVALWSTGVDVSSVLHKIAGEV